MPEEIHGLPLRGPQTGIQRCFFHGPCTKHQGQVLIQRLWFIEFSSHFIIIFISLQHRARIGNLKILKNNII